MGRDNLVASRERETVLHALFKWRDREDKEVV
jgi:hypothetical protein